MFQSSPVPKDGCNWHWHGISPCRSSFNPHPSRRTGATSEKHARGFSQAVSILTRPEGRVQRYIATRVFPQRPVVKEFQSSPVPKDGCNEAALWQEIRLNWFQSSPVPKDGCNSQAVNSRTLCLLVSILTRPEGRVQRG